MDYLDYVQLDGIRAMGFGTPKPIPWANPDGVLREDAFDHLLERLSDISMFKKRCSYSRNHGQKGLDRLSLECAADLDIDPSGHEFVAELHQTGYRQFLRRMHGFRPMKLSFHWHYTHSGGAVSPHCDSRRKIGLDIFCFNT